MLKPILALLLLFLLLPSLGNIESEGEEEHILATRRREPTVKELVDLTFKEERFNAYKVFKGESGFDPRAVGPTQDYGIAQIHLPSHRNKIPGKTDAEKIEWLFIPKNNIKLAKQIFNDSGWYPWVQARVQGII